MARDAPVPSARRALSAAAFVLAWMVCGFAAHLSANAYLLLGVPLVLAFQRFVARQPLRALWVRAGPPLTPSARGRAILVVVALVPLWQLGSAIAADLGGDIVAWDACALVGSLGVAYAWQHQSRGALRMGSAFAALALFCGIFTMAGAAIITARSPWIGVQRYAAFTLDLLLYLPVAFVLEEVVFRGALDSYAGGDGVVGWRNLLGAVGVAALWGLWHLPVIPDALHLHVVVQLLAVHIPIGVFLAFAWRSGGTLLLPALVHALVDAYRNAVLM